MPKTKKSTSSSRPKIKVEMTPENKCSFCEGAKCCNYVTQQIETPRAMSDFDTLSWQLTHPGVEAYKDEDGWFILFYTTCQFLGKNGACGIYETRPQMCRDYDNDYCEYDEPAEKNFDIHFDSYETLQKYCRKRFKNWEKRFS